MFLFYTFSENKRAPGANFVFGCSLEFFPEVALVFSRLLEFPEKIIFFCANIGGEMLFFAHFSSNFGLKIHK